MFFIRIPVKREGTLVDPYLVSLHIKYAKNILDV